MDQAAGPESIDKAPGPKRYWWFKRIGLAVFLLLCALVIADVWWGYVAERRLRAVIDEARARGEAVVPADFFPSTPVTATRNAALSLSNAASALKLSQAFKDFADFYPDDGPPLTAAELELCRTAVAANATSLSLVRKARSQPDVDWGIPIAKPAANTLLPYLNTQRALARFIRWSVRSHHAQGDGAEAVEEIRDILSAAHTVDRGPGVLVGHLVSLGITAIACETVKENVTGLRVGPNSANLPGAKPATRDQVRALIAELTDEDAYRREAMRGWEGERMVVLDGIVYLAGGGKMLSLFPFRFPVVIKPMLEMDAVRGAKRVGQAIDAAGLANWPAAEAKVPHPYSGGDSVLEDVTRLSTRVFLPSFDRAIYNQFVTMTVRRVTALRLAIRLYQIDHDGTYPAALEELMPAYLPALPIDPFAPDGHPIRYIKTPSPALYSVGDNGVDDGGKSTATPSSSVHAAKEWNGLDAVFPLEPAPPATQPSAETQHDQ